MKILITGGSGYIGSRLSAALGNAHEVHILSKNPEGDVRGDIRDAGLDLSAYDAILHLAAISSPKAVEADRPLAWDVNVNGTLNICRKMRKGQALVFISSGQVYDKRSEKVHSEEETPRPNNFYGLTKLVGEDIVRFHSLQLGFRHAIFRLFNVYSPDQGPGLLVGDVMEKYRRGGTIEVHNPRAELDMLHLDDAVRVLSSFEKIGEGTYNLCSGHRISVGRIYDEIGAHLKMKNRRKVVSDKPGWLLGDNSKLRSAGFSFREFSLEADR